ncbi:MAG: response regulator transcription factor [Planctomycetes bacterium]|nr:response regulator transcription factor [Planctomycetota bacterium]MCB9824871.1 response regulator transcription factor [Planctomycetota bacterium]MCB9901723.1 response regulator transcription factor [Planctomycetota bacterium]
MQARILVVEDDERLGAQVVVALRSAGHHVTWRKDGDAAMLEEPSGYDLVVLDLMLPGTYGMDVLKHIRRDAEVPVLVLSARNETPDKVRALELGADDYLTKPFWPDELMARVAARLRRPVLQRRERLRFGELEIDLGARTVTVADADVPVTRVEFELLAALAKRPGAAVPRAWLVDHVLDPERDGTERTLDVHVSRLRKKLGAAASHLATVWGVGYRLDTHAADPA